MFRSVTHDFITIMTYLWYVYYGSVISRRTRSWSCHCLLNGHYSISEWAVFRKILAKMTCSISYVLMCCANVSCQENHNVLTLMTPEVFCEVHVIISMLKLSIHFIALFSYFFYHFDAVFTILLYRFAKIDLFTGCSNAFSRISYLNNRARVEVQCTWIRSMMKWRY